GLWVELQAAGEAITCVDCPVSAGFTLCQLIPHGVCSDSFGATANGCWLCCGDFNFIDHRGRFFLTINGCYGASNFLGSRSAFFDHSFIASWSFWIIHVGWLSIERHSFSDFGVVNAIDLDRSVVL